MKTKCEDVVPVGSVWIVPRDKTRGSDFVMMVLSEDLRKDWYDDEGNVTWRVRCLILSEHSDTRPGDVLEPTIDWLLKRSTRMM